MTKPKKRRMWDDVLPGWRHAHLTARNAGLHPNGHAVLGAVLYFLAAHQKTTEHIRLTQIAHHAGLWDGHGDCPRSATAAAGRWLKTLDELGAIHYEANRSRSIGCRIALLDPDEVNPDTRAGARDTTTSDHPTTRAPQRATQTRDARPSARHPEAESRDQNPRVARSTRPSRAINPAESRAQARAPEGFPEDVVRGEPEDGTADGSDAPASGGAPTDDGTPEEWSNDPLEIPPEWLDDPDPYTDDLTRLLDTHANGRPDDQAAANAIDAWLRFWPPQTRNAIAARLDLTPHRRTRHTLPAIEAAATAYGVDLPPHPLHLPTTTSTR